MAAIVDADVSIIRNTSGVELFFSWAGLNGRTLAAGADAHVPGNIFTMWANDTLQQAAYRAALRDGTATIIKTPSTYVWDATLHREWVLGVDNGVPVAKNPETGSYVGTDPT